MDDVNGIINGKEEKVEKKEVKEEHKEEEDHVWNDDWEEKEETKTEKKPGMGWKIVSAILLVLLIIAIYTHGFNFTGAAVAELDQTEAETKVLDYVNNNLLVPPYTATVKTSADAGDLYQVTLDIAGQEVESYLTKDGKMFFPQGFDLNAPLPTTETTTTETAPVQVSIDDDAVKGKADAPVTIVEFSDFECPFCGRYIEQTYPQIVKDYIDTGKVKYVFRDFPLGFHAEAKPAAMAAECAHEQGKYWEYHDLLFANQDSLSADNYKQWAEDLGLDTTKFDACVDSEKYSSEVDADLADGQSYGVSGTPAFFINGKLISGAQPYSVFKQAIEAELSAGTTVTETQPETTPAATVEVKVMAKKWRFDPNTITVNKGDTVKLTISSELDLNFVLAQFDVEEEVLAGESKTVEFTANKAGTFEYNCGTYCSTAYGELQGSSLKGSLTVN
ncbi:MAG: thioredoxin domain-containing protein [Candidatus Woesearchaeota archaeon]